MEQSIYSLNNGSDGAEGKRLDRQHEYFKEAAGGNLLPENILRHVQSLGAPKIADIGTGTGHWLEDLAKQLPQAAQLDGYDFDVSKFPSDRESRGANINLRFANALEPFPQDLLGQYDVVHVRLMVWALKADQWAIVADHLQSLLKPGGWLLWEELGYVSLVCLPMSASFNEWISSDVEFAVSMGRDIRAPASLKQQVKRAGFVNCSQQIFSTFDSEGHLSRSDVLVAAAEQSMKGMVSKGGAGTVRDLDDVGRVVNGMRKDLENGHEIGVDLWWICGQKSHAQAE